MIEISNLKKASISIGINLTPTEERQYARKIEKFLLEQNIVCEVRNNGKLL